MLEKIPARLKVIRHEARNERWKTSADYELDNERHGHQSGQARPEISAGRLAFSGRRLGPQLKETARLGRGLQQAVGDAPDQ